MSKFQIAKGLLENLPNDYTEGKVYFIYDNVNSENLDIYADIDGVRRKIKSKSSYNPALSVARADALTGADETAKWATRESTGTGSATVRSVRGAVVGWNPLVKTTNGTTQVITGVTRTITDGVVVMNGTAAAASASRYVNIAGASFRITNGHKYLVNLRNTSLNYYVNVAGGYSGAPTPRIFTATANQADGQIILTIPSCEYTFDNETYIPQLFDLTQMFGAGNEPSTVAEFEQLFPEPYYPYSAPTLKPVQIAGIRSTDAQGGELDSVEWETQTLRAAGSVRDELTSGELVTRVGERAYQSGDESDATVRTDGTTTYYPLSTPTTTPISPALPMAYRIEQGGTESIIVPDGEISAAPVLTVAEGESAADLVMDALAAIATPDGPVATANHAVNTYLTMGGKLYKVTTAIASGESIVAGTNVTETTVMDETGMVVLEYGVSTWADFQAAEAANRVVFCKVPIPYGFRLAFLAYRQTSGSDIRAEFQYYRSIKTHTNADQGDEVYIYNLYPNSTWATAVRKAYTRIVAGDGLKSTYANGVLTISLDQ